MSWKSGSELMSQLIVSVKKHVADPSVRELLYTDFIKAFQSYDCDTLGDCLDQDPVFREAYAALCPWHGGWQARQDGDPLDSNPYPVDTRKWAEWKSGWEVGDSYTKD